MTAQARLAAVIVGRWFTDARAQLNGIKRSLQPWTWSGGQIVAARSVLGAGGNFDFGLLLIGRDGRVAAFPGPLAALDGQPRPSAAVTAALSGADASSDVMEEPYTHK